RPCLARGQPRAREPRPAQGDERDRTLPHGCTRRACGALRERGVRPYGDRVQLLPQSALPEVSGCGVAPMVGRPRSGALAGAVLPLVYTLPGELRDIAYQNKRVLY